MIPDFAPMDRLAEQAEAAISVLSDYEVSGRVTKILGLLVEIAGFGSDLSIGSRVHLRPGHGLLTLYTLKLHNV